MKPLIMLGLVIIVLYSEYGNAQTEYKISDLRTHIRVSWGFAYVSLYQISRHNLQVCFIILSVSQTTSVVSLLDLFSLSGVILYISNTYRYLFILQQTKNRLKNRLRGSASERLTEFMENMHTALVIAQQLVDNNIMTIGKSWF